MSPSDPTTEETRATNNNNNDVAATKEQQEQQQEEGHKVFVGNLPFKISEEEIKKFFSDCGTVTKVIIITRYGRSLGFGFVSFNTLEEAEAAVKKDKQEIDERPLNIELARAKKEHNNNKDSSGSDGNKDGESTRKRQPRRRNRKPRADGEDREPSPKKNQDENKEEKKEEAPKDTSSSDEKAKSSRGGGRNSRRGNNPSSRPKRTPTEKDGELSDTMLFVSNLPYKVVDDDLKEIFKEFSVSSAHVVRLRNGMSKGFGFVDVANNVEQTRVLNELSNVIVDGRELIIKQAMASQTPRGQNASSPNSATNEGAAA